MTFRMNTDDVRELRTRGRARARKRQMTLTDQERRILLAELADISAEIAAMQERVDQIATRVTAGAAIRLARSA
jgi:hypothetical protein